MALKDIKSKIAATKRMHTVTRAMEAVSAVKMRKTQASAFAGRPYARAAVSILTRLVGSQGFKEDPLTQAREVKRTALLVITSDKGLAGSLNSGVLREALRAIEGRPQESISVYAYGRKGEEFFRNRGYDVREAFLNKEDEIPVERTEQLATQLSDAFRVGDVDEVIAVYSNFRSTFEQVAVARTLLPLSLPRLSELVADIRPVKGKWSTDETIEAPNSYATESDSHAKHSIIEVLVPKLVSASLYFMLLEAKASEHSARMVAMKNASDKSKDVTRTLTRVYNKIRQAQITREVSEIVSGREALAT